MAGLYARDAAAIARIAHLRFFPLAVTGGQGAWLIDDEGLRLLDFSASWGAASLGHSHPALARAVAGALASQAGAGHISAANLPAVELAERLLELVPGAERVWLGHSGSDANEAAARAVVAATGRPRILAFRGAYHGGTAGSMAVSGHPALPESARAPGLTLLSYPSAADADGGRGAARAALDELGALLAGPVPGAEVAALFYEPIQADGGMIVPPEGFLAGVEAICRRHGILTVADEVKVGLGRTGAFHAHSLWGLRPDLVVLGKGLGGGLPISAVVGPAAILDHGPAFAIQTLHGNPVCAAAAAAVLETIAAEDLAGNAARVGADLMRGLADLRARQPVIADVRGRGLAIGIALRDAPAAGLASAQVAALTVLQAHRLGLVLYYVGPGSDVLELTPALTLSSAEARTGLALLEHALADVTAGKVPLAALEGFAGW
jgi:4-aminobutyrate aminotransferase